MSGIDKIKSQILDEANHSAEVKLAEANEKAERMFSEAKAEAEAEVSRLQAKSQEAVAVYADRVKSSGEMQRKQAILQAKQEVIADVLQNAYEKVCAQDDAAYFGMITRMLEKYAQPGDGIISFNAKDLKRMPKGFEAEMEKAAQKKGGSLKLSAEAKEMDGGFILVYGGVEENCTIRAMFDAKRDYLSDKVHEVLFI